MSAQEEIMKHMQSMAEGFAAMGVKLNMPPASNKTLGTKYVDFDLGKTLTAEVPFSKEFTNPLMMFQGGFLTAAFDEVFGPLTYMAASRPVVTVEMSTTFIRPFVESDQKVTLRAEVVAKTKSLIVLKGEATNPAAKLIATASAHAMILGDEALKKP